MIKGKRFCKKQPKQYRYSLHNKDDRKGLDSVGLLVDKISPEAKENLIARARNFSKSSKKSIGGVVNIGNLIKSSLPLRRSNIDNN